MGRPANPRDEAREAYEPRREVIGAPRLPRTYVPRPRLWAALDRATTAPVTLLVAPVGAGKTLGIRGWLEYTPATQAADATWIQGDATWSADRLESAIEAAADRVNSATGSTGCLLVVDDANALPPGALRLVDDLLSARPESLRLLLASRWDLPLSRMVPELLGQLTVLRGELLHMSDEECLPLIVEHAQTDDPEVVRAVAGRAQGWPAAVVLASRAVGTAPDRLAAARHLGDGATSVPDHVASEVFVSMTPRQRHLLLSVAGEDVVSAATAAHLAREPEAADLFAELEATGLLVARVSPGRVPEPRGERADADQESDADASYRIHPLLAEVVRRRVHAGGVDVVQAQATVRRAVHLDLVQGQSRAAFDRLLYVNAADDAADLLASHGVRLVVGQGGIAEVERFVRARPDVIDERPDTWFQVALARWLADDMEGALHWATRVLGRDEDDADVEIACVRLWRARLGLEPLYPALGYAKRIVRLWLARSSPSGAHARELAVLINEVGVTCAWLGDLTEAEADLTLAISLSKSEGLGAMEAWAMTHLAQTIYMSGRESAASAMAVDALGRLDEPDVWHTRFAPSRAMLTLFLSTHVDVPWPDDPIAVPDPPASSRVHSADLTTKFWLWIRDARIALQRGSVAEAERILTMPSETAMLHESRLPDHLRVVLLIERAFLAAVSGDQWGLPVLQKSLAALGARGEAELVAGLAADLAGDRRRAVAAFDAAAADAAYSQPPVRALALACGAQLLDALGEHARAFALLADAATATEVRRNSVPFLGWTRQGTPMATLLPRLASSTRSSWVQDLAAAGARRPDLSAVYASRTPSPRERSVTTAVVVPPLLSPREREVLGELARGATYADIASTLFLSENTVKTHVSSLYSKLGASRRSQALAVARNLNLF
ncbi:LuxR C-terminal-related transcriptional regulator [Nocardioides sp. CER19]|uniref:helix-turn-helix transcriptional regulator n=1 Tax=Nocardioides sp. CER19 TaxID=3038538 RepID=UPI00244C72B7|nr:LuxR C-terminal-related transcriptional regulator [Nocardioides sp. CER19]MDH2416009.1 LuxR C-terminal-related transcriptional regulator [Nocardioides sp. CER19]